MKKWIFLALCLMNSAYSQDVITKVIKLNYIQSNQIIQLIQPLMQTGEQVSGSGQTLIVKVNPQTLTQIREVIHQLDVAPATFRVSIHQGDANWLSGQNGNTVTYSTHTQSQQLQDQSVQVLSGESAIVSTDAEVPIVSSVGVGFFTGIAYQQHKVKTGFLVHPTLQGSQVKLQVKRLNEQVNPAGGQNFDNQKVDTTVMVPLNKWVSLGSAQGWQKTDSSTTVYTAGRTFSNNATVYVKVSLVKTP